nr:type II toxin-antitoxin system VapC family toxin [Candidatus Thiosymbion oneisti]
MTRAHSLPASFVELSIIIQSRYGPDGIRDLDLFLSRVAIVLIPVDSDQAYIARQAFRRFGKGRHPAGLNYGDCFSYALAKSLGEPLLFKGRDFSQTDLVIAGT